MTNFTAAFVVSTLLVIGACTSLRAQTPTPTPTPTPKPTLADLAKKAADNKANAKTPAKVYTNKDLEPSTRPLPDDAAVTETFTPTPDAVFVCTARSMKALFKAVELEHHGHFTQAFADLKLRDDPKLFAAAQADAASCKAGSYIAAMEKALKAQALEQERLKALLRR